MSKSFVSRLVPVVICVLAIFLWIGWGYYVSHRFPIDSKKPDAEQQAMAMRGQFGDLFGGVNALFTALLLAGAFYTVWLQREELEAMRLQQDDARRESARTALILAHSAQVSAKSAILNMRYQMVKDAGPAMEKADPHSEIGGSLFLFMQANSQEAGKAINELELLSARLREIIESADGHRPTDETTDQT
jgi:hypothetical protein